MAVKMTVEQAIEVVERMFSDSTDETYPFTELFAEAAGVVIEAAKKTAGIDQEREENT